MESKNPAFANLDALLDAEMEDLIDLPPQGVPPTGHYNLQVTASREESDKDGKKMEFIRLSYEVVAINELKDENEADEVKVGQKCQEGFFPIKKDGTVNDIGIGFMKQRLVPFSEHFGTTRVGETIAALNKVDIAASLVRTQRKGGNEDEYNFRLKDVVIL